MIPAIAVAIMSVVGGGLTAWGWRSAVGGRDRALAELELRRSEGASAAAASSALESEVRDGRLALTAAIAQLQQAQRDAESARAERGDRDRKIKELYAALEAAAVAGGGDRVRELMREASDALAAGTAVPSP